LITEEWRLWEIGGVVLLSEVGEGGGLQSTEHVCVCVCVCVCVGPERAVIDIPLLTHRWWAD
jgi:hypothetical protein